jgi:nicotinamidase-related amidase
MARAHTALLVIDMINDFEFEGAARWIGRAVAAARAIATLKRRAAAARVPAIYVNDNFGRWRSDFRQLLAHCLEGDARGKRLAELLRPGDEDYFVLKPRHSGFHSTALPILLEQLGAQKLVLTGVAGDNCVMFTAHDAYLRGFEVAVPRDCIASQTAADNRYALAHMSKVLKADTRPSRALRFGR